MKFIITTLAFIFILSRLLAQQDPEFPKEFIMHLKWHNGMVTNFHSSSPDPYAGGLQLIPQFTLVPHLIRGGLIAGTFYTGKKLQASVGPTVSVKLLTIRAKPFGSAGNINLNFDHLWGTNKQQLFGGGINADILNKSIIGLLIYRDYNLNNWWVQGAISFRLSKVKKKKPTDL